MKRKEVYFTAKEKAEIIEVSEEIKENSFIVKNLKSLISPGTELALFCKTHVGFSEPGVAWAKYPIAAGYSSVGEIVEINGDCSYNVGDIIMHYKPHSDFSIVDSKNDLYFKINDKKNIEESLFTRFGQISYTAVAASEKKEGHVLVYGGGLIGNICAQLFKLVTKREVTVADLSPERLELAKKCNLNTVNPLDPNFKDEVKRITNNKGFDTVVEATGVPRVLNDALDIVNLRGEVILLGSTRGLVSINPYRDIHRKFINIIGAHENRFEKFNGKLNQKMFGEHVLSFIEQGQLKVDLFITDYITIDKIEDAYHLLIDDRDKHLAIIINWE
ncbi:MAG: zinc-dependent alcohol dehydrogenase [Pleomorphochaeta sp.]|jgi:2-desacetyl-2-hydroxyethyl bacteriochlorophyllide A dehydrogenase